MNIILCEIYHFHASKMTSYGKLFLAHFHEIMELFWVPHIEMNDLRKTKSELAMNQVINHWDIPSLLHKARY